MPLTIAIVGRPNVGKSTLFNRLVGRRIALVDDAPGVTRDRREGGARLGDLDFTVIDTAGLEDAAETSLEGRMRTQSEAAMREADLVLFMIDARVGVTPVDRHFGQLLREGGKPVVLIANKSEGKADIAGAYDAYSLGLGDPVALSAEHGEGMADLFSAIIEQAGAMDDGEEESGEVDPGKPVQIAIVGRPNAGKSTLINRMLGEERLLTGPEAGITRDSISVDWSWRDRPVRLFDTAGLRRKARVQEKLEKLSVGDALRAIRFAEVAVLLIDAGAPFEKQDLHIAELVAREGRALVIGVNKWDLVEDRAAAARALREQVERLLPQVRGVPMVTLSGLAGEGVDRLMKAVFDAHKVWNRRVPTGQLNRWLAGVIEHHPPPAVSGRRIRIRYMTQPKSRPPTFIAFCSRPEALPESYTRYLVNGLRDAFKLPGTPIRLHLRKGDNPYA